MPRFLFISTVNGLPWGGSEALWTKVAHRLMEMGHHVAYSSEYFEDEPRELDELKAAGAVPYRRGDPSLAKFRHRFSRYMKRKRMARDYPSFKNPHWLFSVIMEERPDLIVVNSYCPYIETELSGAFEAVRREQFRYVFVSQMEDDTLILRSHKRLALKSIFTGASAVCFGSQHGVDLMTRQLAAQLPRPFIFDNPLNCSGNIHPWPEIDQGIRRFACLGRIDATAKGQDMILAALGAPVWKTRPWMLTFYGRGWHEAYLKDLASVYGILDRVHFAGFKSDIDAVWAEEEICLQPSMKEGTPMSFAEAMLCGRPCLVTDVGRMPEVIEEGVNGWVCGRSVEQVGAALERAWSQQDRWPAMGVAAHDRIAQTWDKYYPATMAKHLLSFIA